MSCQFLDTPIGTLRLVCEDGRLARIEFEHQHSDDGHPETGHPVLAACAAQLTDYFARRRRQFSLPLAARGTPFQQSVWHALTAIPHGELRSYRDIAVAIGKPSAVRAVGAANGRNPLPIVVPCHRVVGSDGSLTGFAGGLDAKVLLFELEGHRPRAQTALRRAQVRR